MGTLIHDLRSASRTLLRSTGFTANAVLTLALGIGANTAVFAVVKGVLLAPLGYPDGDRLVRVWSSRPERGIEFFSVSVPDYLDWQRSARSFDGLAAYEGQRGVALVVGDGRPEEVLAARVTPEVFTVLGTPTRLGRPLVPEDVRSGEARVAVVGHDFWEARLGADPGAVGRTLTLDGEAYIVAGVMPAAFTIPLSPASIWTPLDVRAAEVAGNRGRRFLRVVGRLAPGVDVAQAQAELAELAGHLAAAHPPTNAGWTVSLRPVRDLVTGEDFRLAILVVLGAVGLVLLIACANVANLMLVRGRGRRRELAVRAALGASRARLVLLLIGETALLALLAGAAALAVASWGLDLLPWLGAASVPRLDAIRVDGGVLAFTAGVSVVVVLLSGVIPAFTATRGSLHDELNAGGRGAVSTPLDRRARQIVVIGQLGLATVLAVGATLLVRSFLNLREVDLGFEPRQVLTAQINPGEERYGEPAQAIAFYRDVVEGLRSAPGVAAAAAVTSVPFAAGNPGNLFAPEGTAVAREEAPDADYRLIAGDYFRAMRIPLLAGRTFQAVDDANARSVIVSRSLAERFWPGTDPVGRRLRYSDPVQGELFTIVGVVGDARYRGLGEPAVRPMLYFPHAIADVVAPGAGARSMTLVLRADGQPAALVEPLRALVGRLDPDLPLGAVRTMTSIVDGEFAARRFNTFLLTCFAGLALILATIGAYAVLAYLVAQQRRELAVRMALGARQESVAIAVLKEGILSAGIGVGIGLVAALIAARPVLADLLYGVSAYDPATFGAVAMLLLLAAAIASYVPARRAARTDPMDALRG